MKTYDLVIAEHEEFGGLGVAIQGELNGRDYFEPATNGVQFAHDLIEHAVTPHNCGYVDELIALGGIIAGRVENGGLDLRNQYMQVGDLEHDMYGLVSYDRDKNLLNVPPCKSYLQDEDLMSEIEQFIRKGILSALKDNGDFDDNSAELAQEIANYDIQSLVGWVVKGYQVWKKRFNNVDQYAVSVTIFGEIAALVDNFMSESWEGQTAKLSVEFTTGRVYLESEF